MSLSAQNNPLARFQALDYNKLFHKTRLLFTPNPVTPAPQPPSSATGGVAAAASYGGGSVSDCHDFGVTRDTHQVSQASKHARTHGDSPSAPSRANTCTLAHTSRAASATASHHEHRQNPYHRNYYCPGRLPTSLAGRAHPLGLLLLLRAPRRLRRTHPRRPYPRAAILHRLAPAFAIGTPSAKTEQCQARERGAIWRASA